MIKKQDITYIILLSMISLLYLWGVKDVPFHPDESTQIFMSDDFNTAFTSFSSLFWQKENEGDLRQYYRSMDVPLTRYFIGFGRWISRQPGLEKDWIWSKSWQENKEAGALPDIDLLLASRLSVSIFFPASLIMIYFSARKEFSSLFGFITALFFAINSLVWLHTRRAMAESLLLFNIIFFIYLCFTLKKHEVLLAIPAALAFNAKQTGVILLILGVIEIIRRKKNEPVSSIYKILLKFGITFCLITVFLNPFLWKHPLQAAQAALSTRSEFTKNQQITYSEAAPALVLNSASSKITGFLYQVFLADPIPSESGNYLKAQDPSISNYFDNPVNLISSNLIFKSLFLLFSISGFLVVGYALIKERHSGPALTIWIGSLLYTVFLVFFLPLSFQRYYLPVIPIYCFQAGYFLHKLFIRTPANSPPVKS